MNNSNTMTHKLPLLRAWQFGLRELIIGHFGAAKRDDRWSVGLGAAVVAMTAIAGSAIFATFHSSANPAYRLAAGVISLIATVLAAEQQYLRLEERTTKHLDAARRHQALREEIEVSIARLQDGDGMSDEQIDSIRTRRDEIEKAAPPIPNRILKRAKKAATEEGEYFKATPGVEDPNTSMA